METNPQKLETPIGNSYWSETGAYQKEYDSLWKELVPSKGDAYTIHGELIRCVSRLYYDYCNNGNGNVLDLKMQTCHNCEGCGYEEVYNSHAEDEEPEMEDCYACDGTGEVQDEVYITEYYKQMIDFLSNYMLDRTPIANLQDYLLNSKHGRCKFDDKEYDIYNKLTDAVIYQIITTENKQNPLYNPTKEN
jgi:hypothetical protein